MNIGLAVFALVLEMPCFASQFHYVNPIPAARRLPVAAVRGVSVESQWRLKELGTRTRYDRATDRITVVKLYLLTLGDTTAQDELAARRAERFIGILAPFAMNAAGFFPNDDGSWRLYNFTPPDGSPEQEKKWNAYLDRPEVTRELTDLYALRNFGSPGDFIFKRASLPTKDLPSPFDRLSPEASAPLLGIFRYNADGTFKMILREPYDENGRAQAVLERLAREAPLTTGSAANIPRTE